MVRKLVSSFETGADSVGGLIKILENPDSPTQKENANRVLNLLAKGVYLAVSSWEEKNIEIKDAFASGSVEIIEGVLPKPLRGLGGRIRENYISEPQIINILDALDRERKKFKGVGPLARESLVEKMRMAYRQLADLMDNDSFREYTDQIGMIMHYLDAEAGKLSGVFSVRRGEQIGQLEKN